MAETATNFSGLPAPEIAVEQPAGATVADGGSRDFGAVLLGGSSNLTFTITNSGNADLTGLIVTKDGAHGGDFTVNTNGLGATLAAGASATFTVTFAPGALGARSGALHIANNDIDENPFDIVLTGTGIAPEISVEQPAGTNLVDGIASIDFGGLSVGVSGPAVVFTIRNVGGATLSNLAVTKNGAHSNDFTVDTAGMSTALAPGTSTTFTVTFTPAGAATRTAALHIASDDADENPFDINLTGTGANQSPFVANPIPDQYGTTSMAFSYSFPANTFNEPDAAQSLTYTATKSDNSPLPGWLTFTPGTRTFNGTPALGDVGTFSVKVTATDNGTPPLSVIDEFAITVTTAPSVTTLAAQSVTAFSATLRAIVNPNGLPTTASFQYGEDTSYGLTASILLSPNDGTVDQFVNVPVTGLQPNTTYHFRARATSGAGTTIGGDLIFTTPSAPVSVWRPAGPGSDGRPLYGTYFANATEGWAVGSDGGSIRHTIDGGVTWSDQALGTASYILAIGGSDAHNVWAVGSGGYIGKWDGLAWSPQGSGVSTDLRGVWAADATNAWAVGFGGVILKWNGSAWSAQASGTGQFLSAVWGADISNVWAVGDAGTILKWNGSTWNAQASGTGQLLWSVTGAGANRVWAVGEGGTIRKWNGSAWSGQVSGTVAPLYGAWASDASNVWAVGDAVVRFNGSIWSVQPNAPERLLAIAGADANNIWAVGGAGLIMKWNGSSWTTQSHGVPTSALHGIWGADANNIWAVGGYGSTIVKWDGNAWTQQTSPSIYRLFGVWGADVNNVWAVGEGGTIIKWNGSTWTTQVSGTSQELYGIWGTDANNVWVVGNFGTILKWNGTTWSAQSSPPGLPLRAIWGIDANNIWAVGNGGIIRKYNGTSWVQQDSSFNQNDLYCVWAANANNIWVGGYNGTRFRWNGSTWSNQSMAGGYFVLGVWGTNPNNVWTAFGEGTIQHWNGLSWTTETANTRGWFRAFWGTGPAAVFAVGDDGMIRVNADYSPSVVTLAASGVTSSGATLNALVNPRGRASTATFQHGVDFSYGVNTPAALSPNNGSTSQNVSATIGGLAPGTFYRFRIVGANGFGRTDGNDNLGFTTLDGPDIAVEQPAGNALVDGASSVNLVVLIGNPPVTKTFTVRNTGTLNLTGLAISSDGPDAGDFTVGSLGATTLIPGGSTTFDVTFAASAPTVKTAALHITSNDPDESPFDISLVGSGVTPEIIVEQPAGTGLADGISTVAYGEVTIGVPMVKTFTVTNSGQSTLSLSAITVDGTDAADFTVAFSATNLPPEATITFNLTFSPTTLGAKTAALHIANDDVDESSFDIGLTGTGSNPEIVVEQPAGTALSDGVGLVNFSFVHLGSSATKTFTVRNTGVGDLLGFSSTKEIYTTGAQVTNFIVGPLPTSVPAGGSATFTVTFTPTVLSSEAIWLHLFNSDADENPFDILLLGSGMQPEIAVEQPAGTNLVDGAATIDFGTTGLGAPVTKTFTVRSVGASTLSGLGVFKDGANPEQFQVSALTTALAPGSSATFTVTFNPTNAGPKSVNIHIASNDEDESPFDISLTGNGTAPEIVVEEPVGTDITNHAARTFGSVVVGNNASLEFTVKNTGVADLTGLGITFTGANAADFTIVSSPTAPVPSGGSTTFTARFTPSGAGAKSATLHLANNDENENPFDLTLTGTGLAPEIVVEQPVATNLADGGSRNFGSVPVSGGTNLTFTIKNVGTADLTGLGITIDGADASEFTVTANPAAPIIAGGSTTFTVRFAPGSSGAKTAALHLASNDADESPFDISLSGLGLSLNVNLTNLFLIASPVSPVLSPAFDAATTNYSATASNVVSSVRVAVFAADTSATIAVNGTPVTSNQTSGPIALVTGTNTVTVLVTAAAGPAVTKTYSISVVRPPGDNADLESLVVNTAAIAPAFLRDTTNYAAYVSNSRSNVSVTPRLPALPASQNATITVNGAAVASGATSGPVSLNVGENVITTVVTAEDGTTTKSYTVTVTRIGPGGPGTPDTNFIANLTGLYVRSAVEQPDGKIILVGDITAVNGQPRQHLARLYADGALEATTTFNPSSPDAEIQSAVVQSDGKILIAGLFTSVGGQPRNRLARLHPDGSLESTNTFNPGTGANSAIYSAMVQPDGKILVWGLFTTYDGQPRNRLARLNPDGSLESTNTFNPGTGADQEIVGAALQPDGKILIGGLFTNFNGFPRHHLARLHPDGTVESTNTFNPGTGVGTPFERCFSVLPQPDGKILVAGEFTSVNGQPRNRLARLHADGSLESTNTFQIGTGISGGEVRSLALQADGKIVVGGFFTAVNGQARNHVVRLEANGSVESVSTFDIGTGVADATYAVLGVAVQSNGGILVGGQFTSVNGQPHSHLVRLLNQPATGSVTSTSSSRVEWLRTGAGPEVAHVTFEMSTDGGAIWTALGNGTRIAGGWELTGLNLPGSQLIRARGRTSCGDLNASAGLVQAISAAPSSASVSNGSLAVGNTNGGTVALTIVQVSIGGTNYIELHDANNSIAAGAGATQVDANTIRVSAASVTNQLQIIGGGGDDHFVIDATAGCPLPPGGVNIDGGGQTLNGADTLAVIGTFSSVQYDANNPGAGVVTTACGNVNFAGLEPVDFTTATVGSLAINVNPANLFPAPVTTTLSVMPGAGHEANTRVAFSGGLELIDFGALTNSLTITGDPGATDTIIVQNVGTSSAGHLVIAAQAGDAVLLTNTTLTLGAGKNFSITAANVTLGSATVTAGGTVSFNGGTIAMRLDGPANNQHSRLAVTGVMALSNSPALNLSGSYVPQPGDSFTLIDNDGNDPIIGTFAGLSEGATITFNGVSLHVSYSGGDGNDAVLTVNAGNTPPHFSGTLANYTVNPGATISFTATATDADIGDVLSFSLVNPPAYASITSGGAFTWRTRLAQAGTTSTVTVVVTDNGTPNLSATNSFLVIVNPAAPVTLVPVGYFGGGFTFNVSGFAGPDYVISASTNLTEWVDISTNLAPAGSFQFNDPAAGASGFKSYRVRLQP